MATKAIAWTTGSGNITLTYTGQGNGSISVKSDVNDSFDDRQQTIGIVTTEGSPQKALSVLIKQKGKSIPVGTVYNFDYTGSVQEITLPKGKYKLQCWGAQGGNVTGTYAVNGSKGGYSEGVLTLTKTTKLYVFVGGQGTAYTSSASQTSTSVVNGGWNGGGAGIRTSVYNSGDTDGRSFPRGGGGATDISTVTSSMSYSSGRTTRDSASLLARCIVAGGGAGASARYTIETIEEEITTIVSKSASSSGTSYNTYTYGSVYGNFGSNAIDGEITINNESSIRVIYIVYSGSNSNLHQGQLGAGSSVTFTLPSGSSWIQTRSVPSGDYRGSMPVSVSWNEYTTTIDTSTSKTSGKSSGAQQGGGTSGKGQYPGTQTSAGNGGAFGLGASQSSTNYRYCAGGGGGGWYGGGTNKSDSSTSYVNYSGGGSGFVNIAANAASRPSGYTGLQLDSGTTKDGSISFESTSGGTETGHSGNGYARITVLSQ